MNDAGDMIRVATNVMKKDGTRAIGTYIPAAEPGGKANSVIAAVLKGETFQGLAQVVGAWYVAAYQPIYDTEKNVAGMLYVGIPQGGDKGLLQAIMNIKVGQTGYVYVIDSKGRYVISQGGKRDGEDIYNAKDSNGNFFIQAICTKALGLKEHEIAEITYPWNNSDTAGPRDKIVKFTYFKPWDWIIGVGSYVDEFHGITNEMKSAGDKSNLSILVISALSILLAVLTWYFRAGRIAKPIGQAVASLREAAGQVSTAAGQIASSSRQLAEGASEQAASIEETSSSMEEMASMTKQNAANATQADKLMNETTQVVSMANESMTHLTSSMQEISKASEETSKIIKTIDEIAFQTNLLALNAAVEAARAGESGAGFAVVADEVRNLALRAADAAKNTANLIEGTVKKIKEGSEVVQRTSSEFSRVAAGTAKMGELFGEITGASSEQAQGIEQINRAVSEMDRVVQQNAASAEESASASEEMNAQSEHMKGFVEQLAAIVDGSNSRPEVNTKAALRESVAGKNTDKKRWF